MKITKENAWENRIEFFNRLYNNGISGYILADLLASKTKDIFDSVLKQYDSLFNSMLDNFEGNLSLDDENFTFNNEKHIWVNNKNGYEYTSVDLNRNGYYFCYSGEFVDIFDSKTDFQITGIAYPEFLHDNYKDIVIYNSPTDSFYILNGELIIFEPINVYVNHDFFMFETKNGEKIDLHVIKNGQKYKFGSFDEVKVKNKTILGVDNIIITKNNGLYGIINLEHSEFIIDGYYDIIRNHSIFIELVNKDDTIDIYNSVTNQIHSNHQIEDFYTIVNRGSHKLINFYCGIKGRSYALFSDSGEQLTKFIHHKIKNFLLADNYNYLVLEDEKTNDDKIVYDIEKNEIFNIGMPNYNNIKIDGITYLYSNNSVYNLNDRKLIIKNNIYEGKKCEFLLVNREIKKIIIGYIDDNNDLNIVDVTDDGLPHCISNKYRYTQKLKSLDNISLLRTNDTILITYRINEYHLEFVDLTTKKILTLKEIFKIYNVTVE